MLFTLTVNVLADDIEEEEEKSFIQEIINASTGVENIPKLNSRACLILDRDSKKVLFEKDAYSKRPMASTTKIMTDNFLL